MPGGETGEETTACSHWTGSCSARQSGKKKVSRCGGILIDSGSDVVGGLRRGGGGPPMVEGDTPSLLFFFLFSLLLVVASLTLHIYPFQLAVTDFYSILPRY